MIVILYKMFVDNEFGYVCDVCDRLWFNMDLKIITTKVILSVLRAFPNADIVNLTIVNLMQILQRIEYQRCRYQIGQISNNTITAIQREVWKDQIDRRASRVDQRVKDH